MKNWFQSLLRIKLHVPLQRVDERLRGSADLLALRPDRPALLGPRRVQDVPERGEGGGAVTSGWNAVDP